MIFLLEPQFLQMDSIISQVPHLKHPVLTTPLATLTFPCSSLTSSQLPSLGGQNSFPFLRPIPFFLPMWVLRLLTLYVCNSVLNAVSPWYSQSVLHTAAKAVFQKHKSGHVVKTCGFLNDIILDLEPVSTITS